MPQSTPPSRLAAGRTPSRTLTARLAALPGGSLLASFLATLSLAAAPALGETSLLSNVGGACEAVALFGGGSKAATCFGQHLVTFDMSNAASPTKLGEVEVGGPIWDVDIAGSLAYVCANEAGLVVVDIADPVHPAVVATVDTDGYAACAALAGSNLYLGDGYSLKVFSLATPTAPIQIGSYADGGWVVNVDAKGSLACAISDNTVRVLNVANPAAPTLVGSYVAQDPVATTMTGNLALVAERGFGCKILNLAVPSNPTLLGTAPCDGDLLWSVAVSGTKAYVGAYQGLHVLDIAVPSAPVSLGTVSAMDVNARGVAVSGTKLCVADWGGLALWNVANPAAPIKTSRYSSIGGVSDVAVVGTTAYVTSWGEGLWIFDIANPTKPVQRSHTAIDGWIYEVCVQGGYAYLAVYLNGGGSRIIIYNVSNPQSPILVANKIIPDGDGAYGLTKSGSNLFVATYQGLRIMNVSNPGSASWTSYINLPGGGYDVAVEGSLAAVASDTYALHFVNVANPSVPTLASTVVENNYLNEVVLKNGIAYLGKGFGEIERFNVSNPAQPVSLPGANFGGYTNDLAVAGNTVWVANLNLGVREVDFTGGVGVPVGTFGATFDTEEVAVAGNLIAVGDGRAGFFLFGDCAAAADLNCDGLVNAADLSIFLAEWGNTDSSADFNHDGVVDAADLAVLLSQWG